jgi:hypothetical protein
VAATAEKSEAIVEAGGDLLDGKRADSGRGQLEGKRNTVESIADLRDGTSIVGGDAEIGARGDPAVGQQTHGRKLGPADPGAAAPRGPVALKRARAESFRHRRRAVRGW